MDRVLVDTLEPYKTADGPEADPKRAVHAILLVGDLIGCRIISAWADLSLKVKRPRGRVPAGETGDERWAWLWSHVRIDHSAIAVRAGCTVFDVSDRLPRLKAARMIFPDGTISGWARGVVEREVKKATS